MDENEYFSKIIGKENFANMDSANTFLSAGAKNVSRLWFFSRDNHLLITVVDTKDAYYRIETIPGRAMNSKSPFNAMLGTYKISDIEVSSFFSSLIGLLDVTDFSPNARDGILYIHLFANIEKCKIIRIFNPQLSNDGSKYKEIVKLYSRCFLSSRI